MTRRFLFLIAFLLLAGCSLIWSPTTTVKSFIAAAQKGDVDKMTQLFSSKAIQQMGLDKVRSNNQSFADLHQRAPAAAGSYRMEDILESSTVEGKRVSFLYRNEAGTDSIRLVFNLSREGGAWKIDSIGEPGLEQSAGLATPAPVNPVLVPEPPPPPSAAASDNAEPETSKRAPIAGGLLNGKAITLPKPVYPAIAKAAKASGTVVIQVLIDEKGNVVSAHAVSGHPLLQAASVAAARNAKFSPTKLAGQLVKVSGVIKYNFVPE